MSNLPARQEQFTDLLKQRATYALNLEPQHYRPPARPAKEVDRKRPTGILMDLREPDPNQAAKIAYCEIATLKLGVTHPEYFREGDAVLICRGGSQEVLFQAIVGDVVGECVYLIGVEPAQLFKIKIGDLLCRRHEKPSSVIVFPEMAPEKMPNEEVQRVRNFYVDKPFDSVRDDICRTPGQPIQGAGIWHYSLTGEVQKAYLQGELPFLPGGTEHGWMLDRLISNDCAFNGRWKHWELTWDAGKLTAPIPYLEFSEPHPRVMTMLYRCLNVINPDVGNDPLERQQVLSYFFDWLLWSLGHPCVPFFPEPQRYNAHLRAHDYLYQTFEDGYLCLFPGDALGQLVREMMGGKITPANQASNAIKSIFPGRRNDYRSQLLIDPECDSGRYMLAASNRTYEYLGLSSNRLLAQAAIVNMYFYAPWYLFPFPFLVEAQLEQSTIDMAGRTLALLREKRLSESYFSAIEPTTDYRSLLPIYFVQERQTHRTLDMEISDNSTDFFNQLNTQAEPLQLPGQITPELPSLTLPGQDTIFLPGSIEAGGLTLPGSAIPLSLPQPEGLDVPQIELPQPNHLPKLLGSQDEQTYSDDQPGV
jgi:hypothetical protein